MKTYLIDDDYVCNFITERILLSNGLSSQIISFTSAEDALTKILKNLPADVPDLIFLDLNMPKMNGWDFLEALDPYKEQLKGSCRIYILTSSINTVDTERSAENKLVSGFIHKPITREDVEVIRAEIEADA